MVEIIVGLKAQPTLCFWGKNQDFVTLNSFQGLFNIVSLQSMCYLPVCEMLKQVQHDSLPLSWERGNTFSPLGRGIEGVVKFFISTLTRIRNVRKAHKRIRPLP